MTHNYPYFSEEIELICLVCRLAGTQGVHKATVYDIDQSAEEFFKGMENHQAVLIAKRCQSLGASYDAIAGFGIQLIMSEDGELTFNEDYMERSNDSFDRWPDEEKPLMLQALNDFYKKSKFHKWYESTVYIRYRAVKSLLSNYDVDYDWFDSFFSTDVEYGVRIHLSFFVGPYNYGTCYNDKNGHLQVEPVMGSFRQAKGGAVYGYKEISEVIVHECCHVYCNPLIDKYWSEIKTKAASAYKKEADILASQAYGSSLSAMYDTLVRGCTYIYLNDHYNNVDFEEECKTQENKGFLLIRPVIDSLREYETNRTQYSNLDSFMKEIVKAINNYRI